MLIKFLMRKLGNTNKKKTFEKVEDNPKDETQGDKKKTPIYYVEPLSYEEARVNNIPLKHNPFRSRHIPNKVHVYGEPMSITNSEFTGNTSPSKKESSSSQSLNTSQLYYPETVGWIDNSSCSSKNTNDVSLGSDCTE